MPTQASFKRTSTESLELGLQHHQSGRLQEAELVIAKFYSGNPSIRTHCISWE
jgi:hypothetical protein